MNSNPDSALFWRCLNCGQVYFGSTEDTPPDFCPFCNDLTTWTLHLTVPDSASDSGSANGAGLSDHQLPLFRDDD